MRRFSLALLVIATTSLPALGQERPPALPDTAAFERPPGVPTPRGAMIRSFLVPGWGQAASGAYLRGGVFFVLETGSWFMLGKTLGKLAEARQLEGRRIDAARDSILLAAQDDPTLAQRLERPGALEEMVDSTGAVVQIRELVGSREQQREDWIAQVIFWTLAGAVDAYVAAQLVDFPGEVAAEPGEQGGVVLRYSLPVGRVRR